MDNVVKIHKLMILTDIAFFSFVPKQTKLLILTGKRVLSEKDYKEILKISTKPPDLLKKISDQLNLKKEVKSINKIEVKTNLSKDAIKKLTANNLSKQRDSQRKEKKMSYDDTDLEKINKMRENLQKLNINIDSHIKDPDLKNILTGLEAQISTSDKLNSNDFPPINENFDNNLMNSNINRNLEVIPLAPNANIIKNLNTGLNLNPQINPSLNPHVQQMNNFLKDQKDLAMNNNFNNNPRINYSINLNNFNNNSTEINQISKLKIDNSSSIKEDFDDFDDEEKKIDFRDNKTFDKIFNSTNLNNENKNKGNTTDKLNFHFNSNNSPSTSK